MKAERLPGRCFLPFTINNYKRCFNTKHLFFFCQNSNGLISLLCMGFIVSYVSIRIGFVINMCSGEVRDNLRALVA